MGVCIFTVVHCINENILSPDVSSDLFLCFQDVQHRWWRLIGVEGKASMCSGNPVPLWRLRVKLLWQRHPRG